MALCFRNHEALTLLACITRRSAELGLLYETLEPILVTEGGELRVALLLSMILEQPLSPLLTQEQCLNATYLLFRFTDDGDPKHPFAAHLIRLAIVTAAHITSSVCPPLSSFVRELLLRKQVDAPPPPMMLLHAGQPEPTLGNGGEDVATLSAHQWLRNWERERAEQSQDTLPPPEAQARLRAMLEECLSANPHGAAAKTAATGSVHAAIEAARAQLWALMSRWCGEHQRGGHTRDFASPASSHAGTWTVLPLLDSTTRRAPHTAPPAGTVAGKGDPIPGGGGTIPGEGDPILARLLGAADEALLHAVSIMPELVDPLVPQCLMVALALQHPLAAAAASLVDPIGGQLQRVGGGSMLSLADRADRSPFAGAGSDELTISWDADWTRLEGLWNAVSTPQQQQQQADSTPSAAAATAGGGGGARGQRARAHSNSTSSAPVGMQVEAADSASAASSGVVLPASPVPPAAAATATTTSKEGAPAAPGAAAAPQGEQATPSVELPPPATSASAGGSTTSAAVGELASLFELALHGPLPQQHHDSILELLGPAPLEAALESGLSPSALAQLTESNPALGAAILERFMMSYDATGQQGLGQQLLWRRRRTAQAYFDALIESDTSLKTMETVTRLVYLPGLPPDFLQLFVAHAMADCRRVNDKYMQSRLVRLVCAFLSSLTRNGVPAMAQLSLEVQTFCIEFSRIREAAALFRVLKQAENSGLA